MIADLQARVGQAEAHLRRLHSLRIWVIVGAIASIIGTILKLLPIPSIHGTQAPTPLTPNNTNSLHIGGATTDTPATESRAHWLTTDDIARREKKSPRTILTWISEGRITPPPIQTDRAWLISPDYTITPPPLSAAINRQ